MYRTFLIVLVIAGSAELLLAQGPPPPPARQPSVTAENTTPKDFFGELAGNVYKNTFFSFTVTVPENYTILNSAEIGVYAQATVDLMKSDSARNNRVFDDAIRNQAALLMVAQKPPGSEANAIVELQVRKQASGVTANTVLAESVKMMTGSNKAVLTKNLAGTKFGGRSFVGAEFEVEMSGQKLTQQFFITMQRGYAFLIGLTFAPGADRKAFDEMLSGMKLLTK